MEQENKVSAAAMSLGTATASARATRSAERDAAGDMEDAPGGGAHASSHAPGGVPSGVQGETDDDNVPDEPKSGGSKTPKKTNNVRRIRIERMMSKAELARRANLSVLTIDRVERGYGCRMDTKRKILEALGLSLADRVRVFGEEE
jgi:DNA-binding XRE family transcriptional regulator